MPDFQLLFESAPGLLLVLDVDFVVVAVSDAYLRATGTIREVIVGRPIFDVFPESARDSVANGTASLRASLERVLREGLTDVMDLHEYHVRRPPADGGGFEQRHWRAVHSPVRGSQGEIAYIIQFVEDVTDYILLRQGQGDESIVDGVQTEVFRRANELIETNRRLRTFQEDLEARVQARTADLVRANEELQREIGERKRAEEALKRSEEQLRQSQKLEAVGRLAGGIAHDFNNLLSVVLGYSDLLLQIERDEDDRMALDEIRTAGERGADMTRQLLAFSRQQVLDPKILDLNDVVAPLEKILARVVGEDVELRLALARGLDPVKADRGQIEQVIMNLALNARDAMPFGGKLVIETANIVLDDSHANDDLEIHAGPHVMLAVSDTGIGMDKATQSRVFEPFFTTKEMGKATGLGLSTVFGIVRQSRGSIWLYSEPDTGTTFKIYLPRVEDRGMAANAVTSATAWRGSETVLLVEDDARVRHVAHGILQRSGYRVLVAEDPIVAIELCRETSERIDLLLTDVVMPKMSGRVLAETLAAVRPEMKVIFMSGYTSDVILHHGVLDFGAAFIQKPLTFEAVARKVREILDGRPMVR